MTSPLEKFNKANSKRFNILVDIPQWEFKSLFNWIYLIMVEKSSDVFGTTHSSFNYGILRSIETKHRLSIREVFGKEIDNWSTMRSLLEDLLDEDSEKFIFLLELIVIYIRDQAPKSISYGSSTIADNQALQRLGEILNNGSKWKIVKKYRSSAGLIEVVDGKLLKIAEDIQSDDLQEAWEEAFKPNPRPELAIEKAQAAIEHLASEYRLTNATSKVYGTLLGDIRINGSKSYINIAKPEFDLSNELAGDNSRELGVNDQYTQWLWTGMNLIQKTNPAHHRSKQTNGFKVSPSAAKQAVLIATIICESIKEGYVTRIQKNASPKLNATKITRNKN